MADSDDPLPPAFRVVRDPAGVEYYVEASECYAFFGPAMVGTGDDESTPLRLVNRILAKLPRPRSGYRAQVEVFRQDDGADLIYWEGADLAEAQRVADKVIEQIQAGRFKMKV